MPSFNFKRRYADMIVNGTKRQTIRAPRKDHRNPQVGDDLALYVDQRSKRCRKLLDVRCSDRKNVTIDHDFCALGEQLLNPGQRDIFAIADGFDSFDELVGFFDADRELPFHGLVYYWQHPRDLQ